MTSSCDWAVLTGEACKLPPQSFCYCCADETSGAGVKVWLCSPHMSVHLRQHRNQMWVDSLNTFASPKLRSLIRDLSEDERKHRREMVDALLKKTDELFLGPTKTKGKSDDHS